MKMHGFQIIFFEINPTTSDKDRDLISTGKLITTAALPEGVNKYGMRVTTGTTYVFL